ncbi:MAG: hypothetical protein Q9162_002301 [Coniocarpon cinnabarinum]
MPYFPYSRQSKKKSHRGAITARMLANQLEVAGVNHVITIDLHASQMQGFFRCPVDNLIAEPLLAHWIKLNISDWKSAVCVSKNPGGTKRTTSLADALKLDFGIIMTDQARPNSGRTSLNNSVILPARSLPINAKNASNENAKNPSLCEAKERATRTTPKQATFSLDDASSHGPSKAQAAVDATPADSDEEQNREVVTGRLMYGHIIDDNAPSPTRSNISSRVNSGFRRHDSDDDIPDHMTASVFSTTSSVRHVQDRGLGGSADAVASSDDEEEKLKDPEVESTVTLVGNVKDRTVLIIDDMIDKAASWIAAAETVVKRGGATRVYCMATHGLFGGDCLREMEECDCIHGIVVTNSFPIPALKAHESPKLVVLDVSGLLSEAIRRNHHGESIHQLFVHQD